MTPVRQISAIFRVLSSSPALAAFMIIAENPRSMRDLARAMNAKSVDSVRTLVRKLEGAGLVHTWYDRPHLWARVSDQVDIDPATISIDAGGLPITVGRQLTEPTTENTEAQRPRRVSA